MTPLLLPPWDKKNPSFSRGFAAETFESFTGLDYFLVPLTGGLISEASLRAPYMLEALASIAVFFTQFLLMKKAEL